MTVKKVITTDQAPAAIGPYSQAIKAGRFLYLSGQLPIDPETGKFAGDDISSQTKQSLENIKSILAAAGAGMADIIKTTVFIKDMEHFGEMNKVYGSYFLEDPPARSCVEVARLPKDALVEIECVALLKS